MHARSLAPRWLLAIALVSVHASTAVAAPPPWARLRGFHDGLTRDGALRPEYVAPALRLCESAATASPPLAGDGARARAVCVAAARAYVARCIDGDDACAPIDGPALGRAVRALGAPSAAEAALLARIPEPRWMRIRTQLRRRARPPAHEIDRWVTDCLELAAAPRPPAGFAELARDLCVAAAEAHAASCLGARRCLSRWDRWGDARTAARTLAPLTAAHEASFARILDSEELAEWRDATAVAALFAARAAKQLDRCGLIGKLRERYGAPTAAATATTPAERRRADHRREVEQVYADAKRVVASPVESLGVEQVTATIAELACIEDHADAAALQAEARALVDRVRAHQAAEAACRVDVACQARRKGAEICRLLDDKRSVEAEIRTEHRYARKAGVVDLRRLGSAKSMLEALDDQLAAAREDYRALAGRAFATTACK